MCVNALLCIYVCMGERSDVIAGTFLSCFLPYFFMRQGLSLNPRLAIPRDSSISASPELILKAYVPIPGLFLLFQCLPCLNGR